MAKKDKDKTYGMNIDFNSFGLRPAGSYMDDINRLRKKIELTLSPGGSNDAKPAGSMDGLKSSMDEAQKAADELLKEMETKEAALGSEAPKTEAEKSPETPDLEELLRELDSLVGLDEIKKNVRSLINLAKVRKLREEQNLPTPAMSLHLVFMGNPGTGKTTVARLIAQLYFAIGVLSKGQLVEVDRSGLVAGFVGQTAIKTDEAIKKALGGVLFIDEAYALTSKEGENDFGHEAVETILKAMEDNRDDFVVIVAGYEELMEQFISSNPGLESRFNRYFVFEDYTGEQLYEIFCSMCAKNEYRMTVEAQEFAKEFFRELYDTRDANFGNARDVRNVFENVISVHADRVAVLESADKRDLTLVIRSDLEKASVM
ncbi:MAG: AAA family ATPase [Oscillospiraceae bacterium]